MFLDPRFARLRERPGTTKLNVSASNENAGAKAGEQEDGVDTVRQEAQFTSRQRKCVGGQLIESNRFE